MNVKVPVSIFREGKTFIAYSPVLDLSTSAKSFALVQRRFAEVIRLFLEELSAMGTLGEVLTELGWKRVRSQWSPPIPVAHDFTEVVVPLSN